MRGKGEREGRRRGEKEKEGEKKGMSSVALGATQLILIPPTTSYTNTIHARTPLGVRSHYRLI